MNFWPTSGQTSVEKNFRKKFNWLKRTAVKFQGDSWGGLEKYHEKLEDPKNTLSSFIRQKRTQLLICHFLSTKVFQTWKRRWVTCWKPRTRRTRLNWSFRYQSIRHWFSSIWTNSKCLHPKWQPSFLPIISCWKYPKSNCPGFCSRSKYLNRALWTGYNWKN